MEKNQDLYGILINLEKAYDTQKNYCVGTEEEMNSKKLLSEY